MAFPPYSLDFLDDLDAPVRFTSIAEIERLLSYLGRKLHLDDINVDDDNYDACTDIDATDENFMLELIDRVTAKIMEYLAPRYDAKNLEKLPRIREIATYWACHDLSRRRGNEALYENEYVQGLDALEKYQDGTLYLAAPSNYPRIGLQSYIIDNRSFIRPTKVIGGVSTTRVSGQRMLWEYPFWWL